MENSDLKPIADDPNPIIYEICIEGTLDALWSKRLSNVLIQPVNSSESECMTVLRGEIADQAALFALLLALYDLKFPLVSVRRVESD